MTTSHLAFYFDPKSGADLN